MTEPSFRRLLLRFAFVPIISICGFLAVLGLQLREIATRRLVGSRATTVLLHSDRLQKSMIDEETGIRGYLAVKDPLFLQPYHEAQNVSAMNFLRCRAQLLRIVLLRKESPLSRKITNASTGSTISCSRGIFRTTQWPTCSRSRSRRWTLCGQSSSISIRRRTISSNRRGGS
jgi:CHASE3 domain